MCYMLLFLIEHIYILCWWINNRRRFNITLQVFYIKQSIIYLSVMSSVFWCPLRFPHKNDVFCINLSIRLFPLDIVLCWPSWIDGVFVGHCIVLAFLDWRRLRWTLYCVGLLGLTASALDIVLCWPCIVLAFLNWRLLRWTLYCVGLLGMTASEWLSILKLVLYVCFISTLNKTLNWNELFCESIYIINRFQFSVLKCVPVSNKRGTE
jgi:hypothetical protein